MQRLRSVLVPGLVTVAVGLVVGSVFSLEDDIGLPILFALRGSAEAPADVVIISIDETSTAVLDLPERTRDWPRSVHARLIDRLTVLGASAIALDIDFDRHTDPVEDEALSRAIAKAANVVLVERVDQVNIPGLSSTRRGRPIPVLEASARALAPAAVPDVSMVTQAQSFLRLGQGEEPTFSAAAFQVHTLLQLEDLQALLTEVQAAGIPLPLPSGPSDPSDQLLPSWSGLRRSMLQLRRQLGDDPRVGRLVLDRLVERRRSNLGSGDRSTESDRDDEAMTSALVRLYRDPGMFYLNFYGPPGTIRTVSYHEALDAGVIGADDVSNKVVFVGAGFSAVANADQIDTYSTAYGDMSGVEIQATALANLLAGDVVRRPGVLSSLALLFGFAACAVAVARFLPRRSSAITAVLLAVTYLVAAQTLFVTSHLLMPLVVPLFVQLPLAFVLVRFSRPVSKRKVVQGVCLVTDVVGSTGVSNAMAPDKLHDLLAAYRREIRNAAEKRSGSLETPQVGDSVICFWTGSRDQSAPDGSPAISGELPACQVGRPTRTQASMAALEIAEAVRRFNLSRPIHQLPTRIALHAGEFSVEQDVDGDRCTVEGHTVIVAARLEELCKTFFHPGSHAVGLPILASTAAIEGVDGLLVRDLGQHELKGVGILSVSQIVGAVRDAGAAERDLCQRFSQALELYQREKWKEARERFKVILEAYPDDTPSRLFAEASAERIDPAETSAGRPQGENR